MCDIWIKSFFFSKTTSKTESTNGFKNKTEDSDEEIQRTNPSQVSKSWVGRVEGASVPSRAAESSRFGTSSNNSKNSPTESSEYSPSSVDSVTPLDGTFFTPLLCCTELCWFSAEVAPETVSASDRLWSFSSIVCRTGNRWTHVALFSYGLDYKTITVYY